METKSRKCSLAPHAHTVPREPQICNVTLSGLSRRIDKAPGSALLRTGFLKNRDEKPEVCKVNHFTNRIMSGI